MIHEIYRVVSFEKVAPLTLRVMFDDGTSQVIDFRPVLKGELYGPLQDPLLFEQVRNEAGRLDFLINNVYKIPDPPAWGGGFWDHPIGIWDDQVGIGLRAHYVASWHAAPLLFASGTGGAIVNVSSPGGQSYHFSSSYGAGKAGLDRLTADMAIELEPKGIAAVVLYPGSVSTEFIEDAAKQRGMDLSQSQTPLFVGRTAAALLAADDLQARSGTIQWVEDLAEEFDITDESGTRPPGYARRGES